jgi:signal peptidase I
MSLTEEKKPVELAEKEPIEKEQVEKRRATRIFESIGLFFLELIKVAILAGITIGLVRYFLFKPFYVKGQSMEPNFFEHEYLIIDELSYRFRGPERGEVVVFRSPVDEKEFYLKRIIGLPGERIKIEDNKVIIYNDEFPQGKVLKEEYLDAGQETYGSATWSLGEEQYFVLGDNRVASYDSRRFGPIDKESIVGQMFFRGFPLNRIGLFDHPDYSLQTE